MRRMLAAAIFAAAVSPAAAETQDGERSGWTVSAGYGRVVTSDSGVSGSPSWSGSIERTLGQGYLGVAGGVSSRTTAFASIPDPVRVDGWSAGVYGGRSFGPFDGSLSLDYGRESADVVALVRGRSFNVAASTEFLSAGGGLARSFGGTTRLTPSGSVYWSRTVSRAEGPAGFASAQSRNDGVVGSLGLGLATDVSSRLTLSVGAAAVASSNAAAVYRLSGRRSTTAPQTFGSAGADAWGEISVGAGVALGAVNLSAGAVATVGLPEDTIAVSGSASVAF
ncbi:MAG: autotransporter domain-containing protein [Parvularculaceae bacterium]|nr:autotransporter domain-containing protein [Parvularculaceae bacterium]